MQLQTPDEMRGRVSAVNSLFIGTSNQLGEFDDHDVDPSRVIPSATAVPSASWSRTSVSDATIRRSSASTCATVSARSSGVDIG